MTVVDADIQWIIGSLVGAWGLGYIGGLTHLYFKKFVEGLI